MTVKKPRRPSELERDRRNVSRLYLQGHIQTEIAHELKISQATVSRELKALQAEWRADRIYDINEAKAKELSKIDVLELEYWEAWKRSQRDAVTESEGSNAQGSFNKTTTQGQSGDPRFLDGVMDCIKQRCAILGVEAPKKFDLPAFGGVTVYIPDNSRDEIKS